jgi:UDP-N-acetylmuramoylalanine--D-glutamate ligase
MERVAVIDGVTFYNDSKATSVDATLKALEALADDDGKVILILGGRGKRAPYAPLAELVRAKVRHLILIGEDAETIESELKNDAPIERVESMKDAVIRGFASAEPGDSVLLAPACSSFDMFESFEQRGRVFKDAVWEIENTGHRTQDSEENTEATSNKVLSPES